MPAELFFRRWFSPEDGVAQTGSEGRDHPGKKWKYSGVLQNQRLGVLAAVSAPSR
jgi:hypothetical protein